MYIAKHKDKELYFQKGTIAKFVDNINDASTFKTASGAVLSMKGRSAHFQFTESGFTPDDFMTIEAQIIPMSDNVIGKEKIKQEIKITIDGSVHNNDTWSTSDKVDGNRLMKKLDDLLEKL
jgi:hypothetical protein